MLWLFRSETNRSTILRRFHYKDQDEVIILVLGITMMMHNMCECVRRKNRKENNDKCFVIGRRPRTKKKTEK